MSFISASRLSISTVHITARRCRSIRPHPRRRSRSCRRGSRSRSRRLSVGIAGGASLAGGRLRSATAPTGHRAAPRTHYSLPPSSLPPSIIGISSSASVGSEASSRALSEMRFLGRSPMPRIRSPRRMTLLLPWHMRLYACA